MKTLIQFSSFFTCWLTGCPTKPCSARMWSTGTSVTMGEKHSGSHCVRSMHQLVLIPSSANCRERGCRFFHAKAVRRSLDHLGCEVFQACMFQDPSWPARGQSKLIGTLPKHAFQKASQRKMSTTQCLAMENCLSQGTRQLSGEEATWQCSQDLSQPHKGSWDTGWWKRHALLQTGRGCSSCATTQCAAVRGSSASRPATRKWWARGSFSGSWAEWAGPCWKPQS